LPEGKHEAGPDLQPGEETIKKVTEDSAYFEAGSLAERGRSKLGMLGEGMETEGGLGGNRRPIP